MRLMLKLKIWIEGIDLNTTRIKNKKKLVKSLNLKRLVDGSTTCGKTITNSKTISAETLDK